MIFRHDDYLNADTFDADVLVIGTGAGGAAVGAELAEAGFDVLFAEEGSYNPTSSFKPQATESVPRLYRDAGATVILGRPMIPFVEGRTVGGSTVLNGGMTYRTPAEVLTGWQRITGSPEMGPAALEPLFERVESVVHAASQHEVSVGNDSRLMAEGARRLGWKVSVNTRNQEMCVGANNCVFGCPTGAKQSALVSYMPKAIAAGARCATEVRIERLLIRRGRCVGAVGHAVDPRTRRGDVKVTFRAKAVIVAGGAIQTPHLLLRHRLGRPSGQLGRNFLIHPNAKVVATYPGAVHAWQGVSQYCQIREFHDEGILFAENFIPPSALAATLPWSGSSAMDFMKRYNHAAVTGVLVEDSVTGSVSRGLLGSPLARYQISDHDHARFKRGIRLLSMLHEGALSWLFKPRGQRFSGSRAGRAIFGRGQQAMFGIFERFTGLEVVQGISDFVSAFSGLLDGMGARAGEVMAMLQGDDAAFLLVASPNRIALSEALYFHDKLVEGGIPFRGFVINRVRATSAGGTVPSDPAEAGFPEGDSTWNEAVDAVWTAFRRRARQAAIDRHHIDALKAHCGDDVPYVEVPELEGEVHDLAALQQLLTWLA